MTQAEIEKAAEEYLLEHFGVRTPHCSCMDGHHEHDECEAARKAFLAGAEHAGAKWIKCSERYPDNSSAVLVYVRDGTIYDHCAMYCQAVDYYQFNGQWSHCTDVTHWRPLPLSPEAESK